MVADSANDTKINFQNIIGNTISVVADSASSFNDTKINRNPKRNRETVIDPCWLRMATTEEMEQEARQQPKEEEEKMQRHRMERLLQQKNEQAEKEAQLLCQLSRKEAHIHQLQVALISMSVHGKINKNNPLYLQ